MLKKSLKVMFTALLLVNAVAKCLYSAGDEIRFTHYEKDTSRLYVTGSLENADASRPTDCLMYTIKSKKLHFGMGYATVGGAKDLCEAFVYGGNLFLNGKRPLSLDPASPSSGKFSTPYFVSIPKSGSTHFLEIDSSDGVALSEMAFFAKDKFPSVFTFFGVCLLDKYYEAATGDLSSDPLPAAVFGVVSKKDPDGLFAPASGIIENIFNDEDEIVDALGAKYYLRANALFLIDMPNVQGINSDRKLMRMVKNDSARGVMNISSGSVVLSGTFMLYTLSGVERYIGR